MKCIVYEFRLILIRTVLLVLIVKLTVVHLRLLEIAHLLLFHETHILTGSNAMDGSYWLAVILNREILVRMLVRISLKLVILDLWLLKLSLVVQASHRRRLSIWNVPLLMF